METGQFIFFGSKTGDVAAAMKLKNACYLEEKSRAKTPDIIVKSTDLTLLTKVHVVKAIIFPGVMYGCELTCREG